MSKRAGEFVSVKDLLSEVGKDSIRFMMLNRSNDVELDFDFDKVLEKSKENPVYYVQYCHARIQSIFRTINYNDKKKIKRLKKMTLNLINTKKEILKKYLNGQKLLRLRQQNMNLTAYLFIYTNWLLYFTRTGVKGNDDENFNLLKMTM